MSIKATPPTAALLVLNSSSVFSFEQTEIYIGRGLDNDLVIENPNVSRRHALLSYLDGNFELRDLGSTGGVFINGLRIKTCNLNPGDVITLANIHLVFGVDEFPAAKTTTSYEYPEKGKNGTQDTTTLIHTSSLKR